MAKGWEYAVITEEGERETVGLAYAGPDRASDHEVPKRAFHLLLGEMGGKGWELISVTASWRPDSHYVTQLFFKRPHEGHGGAEELADLARDATWSTGLAMPHHADP
jgi:hypothetical protein